METRWPDVNLTEFLHFSQLVQQNPALIQPLLQQLGANNPQLAQLINQNPEALYSLLAGDDDDEGDFDPAAFGGAEGEDPFQGQTVIQLTESEAEAVRRVSRTVCAPERGC